MDPRVECFRKVTILYLNEIGSKLQAYPKFCRNKYCELQVNIDSYFEAIAILVSC